VSFSATGDDMIEFERAASGLVATEATKVLSDIVYLRILYA
jgi:hypothetical protein